MAITEMAFVPATGWNDPTTFPEKVNNANDVRDMLQLLHDQTKDYLNDTVKPAIDNLQAGTIPTGKIENGAVTTAKIADTTITASQIANSTITGAKIAGTTITGSNLVNKTVTATQIADTTITASQIANTTITGAKMANGTVTSTQLSSTSGSEAVATGNIRAKAVTAAKIADSTITASQIANSTITGAKIAGTTITGSNMVNGTVTATQLASNAVETAKIKDLNVTTDKLAAKAVTAAKIADTTITASQIANTTITGAKMVNGTVTATQLASNAVETAKIKDANVTKAKVDFVETSLSSTLDTKVPTSKAVATYVGGLSEQHVSLVNLPSGGGLRTFAKHTTAAKTLAYPIVMANFTAIKITITVLNAHENGSGALKLQVDGKNSSNATVAYVLPPAFGTTSINNSGATVFTVCLNANGGGAYHKLDYISCYATGGIDAASGFPATITGLTIRNDSNYDIELGCIFADICGVK